MGRRWVWIAVVVAVVVIGVVIWYAAWQPRGTSEPEMSANAGTGAVTTAGADITAGADTNAPAAVIESARETVADDTMIEWYKLELLVVAKDRTWLSVSVDGERVADLTLERGEQRQWEADESFRLDVGNGGGLELYLDGEYLGTAGSGSRLVEGLVVNENGMSR